MTDLLKPKQLDAELGPVLRRAQGDAWSRVAAVVARGLTLDFPVASVRFWLRVRGDHDVAELAESGALFQHLVRKVRAHGAETHDQALPIRRAVAALLSPPALMRAGAAGRATSSTLALAALLAAASAPAFGGRVPLSGDQAAVVLGCTPQIARRRLQLLTDAGVLRKRTGAGASSLYALAVPKRKKAIAWAESDAATELVEQVAAGSTRTWLHALLSPELGYGQAITAADVWVLMAQTHGVDPAALGVEQRSAQRGRQRLRAVGAHDLESLLAALSTLTLTPDAEGVTPLALRQLAQEAYEAARAARLITLREARAVTERAWANARKLIAKPPAGFGYPPNDPVAARAWCERVHAAVHNAQGDPAKGLRKALQVILGSAVKDPDLARELAAVAVDDSQLTGAEVSASEPTAAHVA